MPIVTPPGKQRSRSKFHLQELGYASQVPHLQKRSDWSYRPPRKRSPRSFKSEHKRPEIKPVIKPVMASEWEIRVRVPSAPSEPVAKSPAEARLQGVVHLHMNAWRAP
jgi:hypothetical protein